MKKIYTIVALLALGISANAQNKSTSQAAFNGPAQPSRNTLNPNLQANGDTLMWMPLLGYYINPTDQPNFAIQIEDIDGLTVETNTIQCDDWCAFYSVDPADIDPNQGDIDTGFFWGATSWFNPVNTADNWLEFGPITLPASGGHVKWNYKIQDNSFRDGYEILVNTNSLNFSDFTNPPIFAVADNAASTNGDTTWTAGPGADMSAYAGQTVYIAFHHNASDMFILWIDNILVIEGPLSTEENNSDLTIGQNMPNPATGNTVINYSLKSNSDVDVVVYDVTGAAVMTSHVENQAAGAHTQTLNVENLAAGVYYYTVTANGVSKTNKMVVTK
jgi:hypothetical protein